MKYKSKFTSNQLMSIDDMMESLRELIFEIPGSLERKYIVVVVVNHVAYVYRFADATSHEDALQRALRAQSKSIFSGRLRYVPRVRFCNDKNCDCGQLPRLITYIVDLSNAA